MTDARGLSGAEARNRLRSHGPNALPEVPSESLGRRFVRQFQSPLIYILLVALVLDLVVWWTEAGRGIPYEAAAIAIILVLNAGLGVWQQHRAEEALAKLAALAAPQVWVLRDGELQRIPSMDIVPGDVVRVESGDRLPADGTAFEVENLMVDESVLTGESLPIDKRSADEVYSGTLVVRGSSYLEVSRTGPTSAMGRLAVLLGEVEDQQTPLERRLDVFARRIARWVFVLAALIVVSGLMVEGFSRLPHVVLFAVALAVAAVPEGLPAVLTSALALGVERMARRKAVVRRLSAVEALGSVTVIATDKTGTLTENRMEVRKLDAVDVDRAICALVLANDAELESEAGDPLEQALLQFAQSKEHLPARIRQDHRRLSSRPFDADWKYMRVTVAEDGGSVSYLKGAPEVVLERSVMTDADRRTWEQKAQTYAAEGYRVLALAVGNGERETELTWLGLVLLWDPPRPEVRDAVLRAREAGIRVLMITGDHPATALSVAGLVGIPGSKVITGPEFENAAGNERASLTADVNVFARMKPEHKLKLVEAMRQDGEVVAVTGDGVNDAAALKQADVGVAMGQRGSDVAREVSDLVLLDDNFATIVAAIDEGRNIYENIQKFIRFLFSTNLSEVLVVTLGAFAALILGLRDDVGALLLPLTAAQLLWINLVTDGAPALALGLDRNPTVMDQIPRDPAAPLLDRVALRYILWVGTLTAAIAFVTLGVLPWLGQSLEVTRSATFFLLATAQLLLVFPARRTAVRPLRNWWLLVAVVVGLGVQVLVVVLPGLMQALNTVRLPALVWFWVAVGLLLIWALGETVSYAISKSRSGAGGIAVAAD